jgi:methylamine dehydrogenase heavy chain
MSSPYTGVRWLLAAGMGLLLALPARGELAAEPTTGPDTVVRLQAPYPASWAMVHNFSFAALIDSSFGLVDTDTGHFKGMISAGQFATLQWSEKRRKFYVGETIHSRGNRGTREDLIAVYDFENLKLVKDIVIPTKRANSVVLKASTGITADDRFLVVYNMDGSMSLTVIDLDSESVAGEIPTPGCSLVYPDRRGGIFQLCGDGRLAHLQLDRKGGVAKRTTSEVFNHIDEDPLSEKASLIGDTWYFFTYQGEVQPINIGANTPTIKARWWLTSDAERKGNWRPAGWHGNAGHANGTLYVAMTPNGYNGSHKDPALEVWVYEAAKAKRTMRIKLESPALSIAVANGRRAHLLVLNAAGGLDVYDTGSGKHLRTIHDLGSAPMMVHAVGTAR